MSEPILSNINRLYPPFAELIQKVLDECDKQKLDVILFETERTWNRQVELWRQGRNTSGIIVQPKKCVTWAAPGWSPHHYGLAADIIFLNEKRRPTWDNNKPWTKVGSISSALKVEWGGLWDNPKKDRPHHQKFFRPFGMSHSIWYKTLRAEYWKNKKKEDVWKLLDKKLNFN